MKTCSKCLTDNQDSAPACTGCGQALGSKSSSRVGLVVIVLSVGLVSLCGLGSVFAIAIPNFVEMQYRAKRSEVPSNLKGIRVAELGYHIASETYLPCGSREQAAADVRSGGKQQRAWANADCWQKLGWSPDGRVRGAYWVEVSADGQSFTAYGISDVDGDGTFAEYAASETQKVTFLGEQWDY